MVTTTNHRDILKRHLSIHHRLLLFELHDDGDDDGDDGDDDDDDDTIYYHYSYQGRQLS